MQGVKIKNGSSTELFDCQTYLEANLNSPNPRIPEMPYQYPTYKDGYGTDPDRMRSIDLGGLIGDRREVRESLKRLSSAARRVKERKIPSPPCNYCLGDRAIKVIFREAPLTN